MLLKYKLISFAPGLHLVKDYQSFTIDPCPTDESTAGNCIGCKLNVTESISTIKDETLISLQF